MVNLRLIPSGTNLNQLWKITMLLMGKLAISTGPFSIATCMLSYQRVVYVMTYTIIYNMINVDHVLISHAAQSRCYIVMLEYELILFTLRSTSTLECLHKHIIYTCKTTLFVYLMFIYTLYNIAL